MKTQRFSKYPAFQLYIYGELVLEDMKDDITFLDQQLDHYKEHGKLIEKRLLQAVPKEKPGVNEISEQKIDNNRRPKLSDSLKSSLSAARTANSAIIASVTTSHASSLDSATKPPVSAATTPISAATTLGSVATTPKSDLQSLAPFKEQYFGGSAIFSSIQSVPDQKSNSSLKPEIAISLKSTTDTHDDDECDTPTDDYSPNPTWLELIRQDEKVPPKPTIIARKYSLKPMSAEPTNIIRESLIN